MNAWLNLRELLNLLASDAEVKKLDDRTQRVLEWVVTHHDPHQPIYVQHIVSQSGVASPATIHKALGLLERCGYLNFEVDIVDSRRRIVSPAPKAIALLDKLDKRVNQWVESLKH